MVMLLVLLLVMVMAMAGLQDRHLMACRKVLTLILNAAPSAPVQMARVKVDKIRMVPLCSYFRYHF
jgi:hypothetical protein